LKVRARPLRSRPPPELQAAPRQPFTVAGVTDTWTQDSASIENRLPARQLAPSTRITRSG
jgi:hypothetical protein